MIEGDRFRLVGSHAQGLKSIKRGRGGSAATATAAAASAISARCRRDIAACACDRGDDANGTARALRRGHQPPLTHFIPPYGLRVAMQMQPAVTL